MAMSLAELSKGEAVDRYQRLRGSISNMRAKVSERQEQIVGTIACVGGGATCGWMTVAHPDWDVAGIDGPTIIGSLAAVAGVFDLLGKHSNIAGEFGKGMLAAQAAKYVEQHYTPEVSEG